MKKILLIVLILYFLLFGKTDDFSITKNKEMNKKDFISGKIEIPKIKLKEKFYNNNNVDKNIIIVDSLKYPNTKNSILILAGHSGSGFNSYFNDLYKLTINDYIYIRFKNVKYKYKIVNIYNQKKTGKITIYRDTNKTTLVLVTCTNDDNNSQTVYISELI